MSLWQMDETDIDVEMSYKWASSLEAKIGPFSMGSKGEMTVGKFSQNGSITHNKLPLYFLVQFFC